MLEHDIAISSFIPRIRRRAYHPNLRFFKKQNFKLIDKFRSRMIPSVHLEILRNFGLLDPVSLNNYVRTDPRINRAKLSIQNAGGRNQQKFEYNVRLIWSENSLMHHMAQDQAYWYYVDAITHPNMPHKQLWDFGNETVVGLCLQMWDSANYNMSVLADALEDQDFPDHDYLKHLRTFEHWSKANFLLQFFLSKRIGFGPEASGRTMSATERRLRRNRAMDQERFTSQRLAEYVARDVEQTARLYDRGILIDPTTLTTFPVRNVPNGPNMNYQELYTRQMQDRDGGSWGSHPDHEQAVRDMADAIRYNGAIPGSVDEHGRLLEGQRFLPNAPNRGEVANLTIIDESLKTDDLYARITRENSELNPGGEE